MPTIQDLKRVRHVAFCVAVFACGLGLLACVAEFIGTQFEAAGVFDHAHHLGRLRLTAIQAARPPENLLGQAAQLQRHAQFFGNAVDQPV